ncbi:MAG: response regulator transcription factor [Sphingorhabdus sp.]
MASNPITIGIVEDDEDMRSYLAVLFRAEADLQVAFECARLDEALALIKDDRPDICLVDIRLPDGSGLDFIKALVEYGDSKSLILTVLGDRASVMLAFEVGANGYLLKDTPPEQIKRDIRAVIAGGNPISPQAATHVISMLGANSEAEAGSAEVENVLSEREADVLLMFSRGLSYKETAETLGISVHTIADHVKSIYTKMSVHSRNEAVFEAVQNGWLEL